MTKASAPAKLILCGEHAVVYGRPAIAVPLADLRAAVELLDAAPGSGFLIEAPDLQQRWMVADSPDHPLSELVASALERLGVKAMPDLSATIASRIPIASGMGSGAAVATALVRALAAHMDQPLAPHEVAALVYGSERRFHGTPSGIDNTVIAYERPIWFVRGARGSAAASGSSADRAEGGTRVGGGSGSSAERAERAEGRGSAERAERAERAEGGGQGSGVSNQGILHPSSFILHPSSFILHPSVTLLIGDTGARSPTRLPVGEVRRRWEAEPARYEALFDAIAAVVAQSRDALACGDLGALGRLLNENHALLQQLGVSSPELDWLVERARKAGALGAKLSGAGWGGVMFALVTPETAGRVAAALAAAGAVRTFVTSIGSAQEHSWFSQG